MKETKGQKIERLEKIIGEQKAELTKVKKDRKRLNYAVKRLEKKREQLSLQSSKEDTAKIKELEKQIGNLKIAVEEKEKAIETLRRSNSSYSAVIKRLKKDLTIKTVMSENEAIGKVVETLCKIKNERPFNGGQLQHFKNGERYFDYSFKDYPDTHIRNAIFSTENLIIQIHPKNGRDLGLLDRIYLEKMIGNRLEYLEAMNEFGQFKKSNPSNDELVEWTYNKGMELLPIYENEIF